MTSLSEFHRTLLHETSGLPDSLIDSRGYHTISKVEFHKMLSGEEKDRPFHSYLLKASGWMGIPIFRPDGKKHCEILRVDGTLESKNGFQRYVWPANGVRNALDLHPQATHLASDPKVPLIVTEGIKKADAIFRFSNDAGEQFCVLGQNGCWGWRSNPKGASIACPDWHDIALEGREVYIVVDSDYLTNDSVKAGWDACAHYLQSKVNSSNKVRMVVVPQKGRSKQGADDFLLDHSLDDLLSLAISPAQTLAMPTSNLEVLNGLDLIDNADDEVPWMVQRAVAKESITVIAGHTQTYKTWISLDLSLSVMLGKNWMGHPLLQVEDSVPLFYVNKEMRGKLGTRIKALVHHPNFEYYPKLRDEIQGKLGVIEQADFDLKGEQHVEALINACKDHGAKLLILDSLSMVWSGDENSNSEVGLLFHKLRRIIEATGCSIVILHHLVKPSKDRSGFNPIHHMRGAGQLGQQSDAVFLCTVDREEEDGKTIRIINAKSRDEREMPAFLTKFVYGEGISRGLTYLGEVVDVLAQEAKDNPANIIVYEDFVMQLLLDKTDMKSRPLKMAEIQSIVKSYWSSHWGETPGDKKLARTLKGLRDRGNLTMIGTQRQGFEYMIAPPKDEEEEETKEQEKAVDP